MAGKRWLVLSVKVPSAEFHDDLTEGLIALGGPAVEEDDDLLTTFLPEPDEPEAFLRATADRLEALAPGHALEVLWRWQDDEDWSVRWKEGLAPRRVGRRIIVTPPWVEPEHGAEDIVLAVEPSMAFGTGEHETTRGVLRLMEDLVVRGAHVLDVGTGSGILAMAAIRLGAGRVHAVERDEDAVASCRENLARNDLEARIDLVCASVDDAYLEGLGGGTFDLVLANVLSRVIEPLLPRLAGAMAPGGALVLGGVLEQEAPELVRAAAATGLRLTAEDREGGWWSGCFATGSG